eukprot:jgi/Botrbrau1/17616/Bobra.0166s0052.1
MECRRPFFEVIIDCAVVPDDCINGSRGLGKAGVEACGSDTCTYMQKPDHTCCTGLLMHQHLCNGSTSLGAVHPCPDVDRVYVLYTFKLHNHIMSTCMATSWQGEQQPQLACKMSTSTPSAHEQASAEMQAREHSSAQNLVKLTVRNTL